jgi:hypothetical protein
MAFGHERDHHVRRRRFQWSVVALLGVTTGLVWWLRGRR